MEKFIIEGGHPLEGQITPSGNKIDKVFVNCNPAFPDCLSGCFIPERENIPAAQVYDRICSFNPFPVEHFRP